MSLHDQLRPSDLRGLARLAGDGVAGTSRLVEHLHATISGFAPPLGVIRPERTRGVTRIVYRSIRGVNALVGTTLDAVTSRLVPWGTEAASSPARERWLAALNGVLGDHLSETDNPLAIPMGFRQHGRTVALQRESLKEAFETPSNRLLVTVHGLCMNDLDWGGARGIPERLGEALGYTTLHLHYNTGRPIRDNGSRLARRLESLIEQWPRPVEEIVLIGHSMGGLVVRCAIDAARAAGNEWVRRDLRAAFLGTPHHGAPMERWGSRLDALLGESPYSAPFRRLPGVRSAGIRDLRQGLSGQPAIDSDWLAVAARTPGLGGDGLVPVDSALGRHRDPRRALAFAPEHCLVIEDAGHLRLLDHPAVYRGLRNWLRPR